MTENSKDVFIFMSHEEYMNYMNSQEIMGKLIEEIERLKAIENPKINISGYLNIISEKDLLSRIEFEDSGTPEEVVKMIKEAFKSSARIEMFSNNIGEIIRLKRDLAKYKDRFDLIPKWISSIFGK